MNMVIGRRQVVLAALVVALGTAIFLNYKFSGGSDGIAGVFHGTSALGDTSYVDDKVSASASNDIFAQTRLTRQQARDSAMQSLKTLMTSSGASSATSQTQQQISTAIKALENTAYSEQAIENLVIAKGFNQCVAMINNETGKVSVIVKPKSGDSLSASEAAQIMDIAKNQTKIDAGNINIIPAK